MSVWGDTNNNKNKNKYNTSEVNCKSDSCKRKELLAGNVLRRVNRHFLAGTVHTHTHTYTVLYRYCSVGTYVL